MTKDDTVSPSEESVAVAQRNTEKRNQILEVSYDFFSRMPYDEASLSLIAEASGINKSLLQHYHGRKADIIRTLLDEILSVSESFMKEKEKDEGDMFQTLSDFNMLFFKVASENRRLERFIVSSVSRAESLSAMTDSITHWLRDLCGENSFSYLQLRTAVSFSMAGSMKLYQERDELGIDYRFICRNHIHSLMSLLQFEHSDIDVICRRTDDRLHLMNISEYLSYLHDGIAWFII